MRSPSYIRRRAILAIVVGLLNSLQLGAESAPPAQEDVNQAITKGVAFLIASQNKNGSWGSATKTKGINIYAPIPGAHHSFRTASSALALSGLIAHEQQHPDATETIERAEQWLMDNHKRVKRASADALYNVWAHAYTIRTMADLAKRLPTGSDLSLYQEGAQWHYEHLLKYELLGGGWSYFNFGRNMGGLSTNVPSGSNNSFVTATVLTAIAHASEMLPLEINERRLKLSVKSLLRQRLPDGSYLYGEYLEQRPRHGINRPAGSLARTPASHAALLRYAPDQLKDGEVAKWARRFIQREGFLSNGRKRPLPHEAPFAISGYFYFYGHYYLAEAMLALSAPERQELIPHLLEDILALQEKDGSWWDYPLYDYHKAYGTGYVLRTLEVHGR